MPYSLYGGLEHSHIIWSKVQSHLLEQHYTMGLQVLHDRHRCKCEKSSIYRTCDPNDAGDIPRGELISM